MNDYISRIQNQSDLLMKELDECDTILEESNNKSKHFVILLIGDSHCKLF